MTLSTLLLRLYPRAWRSRYGDEFQAMLDARPLRLADVADVALNAIDAHINPTMTIFPMNERMRRMLHRMQRAELGIFFAYAAFVLAGIYFSSLMDDSPYPPIMRQGGILNLGSTLGLSWDTLAGGSLIAFFAVLAGGIPIGWAVWHHAPQMRRLFAVPLLLLVACFIPPMAYIAFTRISSGHLSTTNDGIVVAHLFMGAFLLATIGSMIVVARLVHQGNVPETVTTFARVPGIIATLAMALMFGATLAWGIIAHVTAPQFFDHADLLALDPNLGTWLPIVLVMGGATIVAATCMLRDLLPHDDLGVAVATE